MFVQFGLLPFVRLHHASPTPGWGTSEVGIDDVSYCRRRRSAERCCVVVGVALSVVAPIGYPAVKLQLFRVTMHNCDC
jgi:hypothetical protein